MKQALVAGVDEFDRIFDRQNVLGPVLIDVLEDRRQGRGLARSRRSCHQHQPLGHAAHLFDHRG